MFKASIKYPITYTYGIAKVIIDENEQMILTYADPALPKQFEEDGKIAFQHAHLILEGIKKGIEEANEQE